MTYPTNEDNAEHLLHFIDAPQVLAETLTSGTALQNPTADWAFLILDIAQGSAGTVKVDIGVDNTTNKNIIAANAANAASAQHITVPVPPGYFVKVTVAVAAITQATLVTL